MSEHTIQIDDQQLLKLLELGQGSSVAAKELGIPPEAVDRRVKEYVAFGILRCNGDGEEIDWKLYGRWLQRSGNGSRKQRSDRLEAETTPAP